MMKILWITNMLFPEAMRLLTGQGELKTTGGWMLGAAQGLLQSADIQLIVASVSPLVQKLTKLKGERMIYYVLPWCNGNTEVNSAYQPYWKQVYQEVLPDVVHIHGTEYSHGHAYLQACPCHNVVISIQGLVSVYSRYYSEGMSWYDIFRHFTIHDLIKGSIFIQKNRFAKSGIYEKDMISKVNHIIGRTSWDRAHVWAIHPEVTYHFCNETLRESFYEGETWDYDCCRKHSIFLSQGNYPIKGLHQVLKAMPLILRHYPDTVIRVAGKNLVEVTDWNSFIRFTGYGWYIKRLIRQLNLEDKVFFLGNLDADQMKQEYLQANVFVCPSSIENSPNSLGEAQILGVPCVASYVGGVPDMMVGKEDYLYRYQEVEMLAYQVCRVFKNEALQPSLIGEAQKRHNPQTNREHLYKIYMDIVNCDQ